MKKRPVKLQLSRETIHRLTRRDLRPVGGGKKTFLLSDCMCQITMTNCKFETCDC